MSVFKEIFFIVLTTWMAEASILYTARCRSRCHSEYTSPKDQQKLSQCLAPCVQDYSKLGKCIDFCKPWDPEPAPCHYSCKYVKRLYKVGDVTGTCSRTKPPSYEYCDKNVRCDELRKCCYNSCEDIVVHGEEVKITVTHVTSSSLVARWKPSNITGAVYIIQYREVDSTTIYYTENDWTDWAQLRQGFEITGMILKYLPSGVRLQLRVAVVDSTGLQSIGPATPVVRTLFNASKPSGPENVWVTKKSYTQSSVNVTLSWTPPAFLDVPVHSYRLYWKQIPVITADLAVFIKKRTRVEGFQYNYTIKDLKTDARYNIEIQAICLWQKKRLKSPKVTLNISTGHVKDTGKGTIDVYFPENKSGKDKKYKHPPKFYDEETKTIEVILEKQEGTTKSPSKDPSSASSGSVGRIHPNVWLPVCVIISLFAFWTN